MSFWSNFLKPGWKHTDPRKRIDWIESCQGRDDKLQAILTTLATTDADTGVRAAAIKGLLDDDLLLKITSSDPVVDLRAAALAEVHQPEKIIAWIKGTDRNDPAQQALTLSLVDSDKHHDVRIAATSHLRDQEQIKEIAVSQRNLPVRMAAIEHLDCQETLATIGRTDEHYGARLTAVKRLIDQEVLAEIALGDDEHHVCEAAIDRIDREDLLLEIASKDVKGTGIDEVLDRKCETQEQLARVLNSRPGGVYIPSFERITDRDLLLEFTKNPHNFNLRSLAYKKLGLQDSPEAAIDNVRNAFDVRTRLAALERVDDTAVLREVTATDESFEVRRVACEKLGVEVRFRKIPVDGKLKILIAMTRGSVGGVVNRIDLNFKDGSQLRVEVVDEAVILLPDLYKFEDVKEIEIPYEQART